MSVTETNWEQPLISVDVIPVRLDKVNQRLNIVLAKRLYEPFLGVNALPGVLLTPSERVSEAAMRALESKAGIHETQVKLLTDVGVSDNPDRDPRGATLSVIFLAVLDSDTVISKEGVHEVDVTTLGSTSLPFDHANLIHKALVALEERLFEDKQTTQALMGTTFKTKDVQVAYTSLATVTNRREENQSNLSRKLRLTGWLTEASSESSAQTFTANLTSTSSGRRGRPSVSWSWK
jgi:8-oxo-dGTP diphosphatase